MSKLDALNLPVPDYRSDDGTVYLYRGDCLDILPQIPAGVVDAVVTDPPYSSGGAFRSDRTQSTVSKYVQSDDASARRVDFTGDNRDQRSFMVWCTLWMTACRHASSSGAVLCSFVDWRQVPILTDSVQCAGWVWRNLCTWWKPGCRMQKGRFSSSAEFVVYASNGPHESDGADSPQNVISCATLTADGKEHIAEKPHDVVRWALGVTRAEGLVLDPFVGAGTTGYACVKTNRPFIGIELDEHSFDIAVRRIEQAFADQALFAGVATGAHE